ncbi:hypothetical protein DFH09DRAFT_1301697 [Mycena vulgaris]|nr:hypothetical protein DFH09DRAFT_1301697 [Mycena vulgaris]
MAPSKLRVQIWEKNTGFWKKVARIVLGGYRYDYRPSSSAESPESQLRPTSG